jgi:hypothetical protein
MPSSDHNLNTKEMKIISELLKKLPNEINGGMVAALIVNILFRYGMYSEWEKIIEAVEETLEDIESVVEVSPPEVLVN